VVRSSFLFGENLHGQFQLVVQQFELQLLAEGRLEFVLVVQLVVQLFLIQSGVDLLLEFAIQ